MNKDKVCKVFVYGTLKEGRPLDRPEFARIRTSVEEASIKGDIFDLGWYPTVKLAGKGKVYGEIHTFPSDIIRSILLRMDRIEGYDINYPDRGLYNRHVVEAKLKSGGKVKAWVYEKNGDVGRAAKIEDGVWEPK
jgi:gamma-glutamylcyclotransferase (GGCT)/AIG2-like uncharacterized protein YtfP